MSAIHAQHGTTDETTTLERSGVDGSRRRSDLDRDLVAVLAMVAILLLTALCFLGRTALPL